MNPMKTAADQVGVITAAKGSDGKEKSESKTSKNTTKEKSAEEIRVFVGAKKSTGSVSKSDRSPNTKGDAKSSHKSPVSSGSKMPPSQSEKSGALEKEKAGNQTEPSTGKDLRNSPDKQKKMPSPNKKVATEEAATSTDNSPRRGRPSGSKDKQKRKSFVHKAKRTQDGLEVGANTESPAPKRKFSKTASVVNEMSSSSIEPSTSAKRPLGLDVPTVNASKSPKRRKVSTSGSPVKQISTRPRGGVDGDSWVCSLCGKRSGNSLLGDLYGPYKTKFAKEKTDNPPAKDGKLSQKLSSPGRKSGSSSEAPADRKSSSSSDVRDDEETCDVDLWIHRDCGVWSPGVFMLGRTIHGLEQAVESAAQHVSIVFSLNRQVLFRDTMNVVPRALMRSIICVTTLIHLYPSNSHCCSYHRNHPRVSLAWLRSSVGATVDQIRGSWVRFPPRSKILTWPRAISHFLTRANAQLEIHGSILALYLTLYGYSPDPSLVHRFFGFVYKANNTRFNFDQRFGSTNVKPVII